MTTIEKLNKSKTPIVKIDKSLEKFRGKNLFPEKLAKANEVIAKVGLPETTSEIKIDQNLQKLNKSDIRVEKKENLKKHKVSIESSVEKHRSKKTD